MVNASEAVQREAPNSACTTGSATTTDHMPTLPSEPISTATASRAHARRESGTKAAGSLAGFAGACTGRNFVAQGARVKRRDEMLVMQMRGNCPFPGRDAAFFMPLRRAGIVPDSGVPYGPGSAAHQAAKSGPLRCVRGTHAVIPAL